MGHDINVKKVAKFISISIFDITTTLIKLMIVTSRAGERQSLHPLHAHTCEGNDGCTCIYSIQVYIYSMLAGVVMVTHNKRKRGGA